MADYAQVKKGLLMWCCAAKCPGFLRNLAKRAPSSTLHQAESTACETPADDSFAFEVMFRQIRQPVVPSAAAHPADRKPFSGLRRYAPTS